jgi:hypothetical protein
MKIAIDVHSLGTGSGVNETFARQLIQEFVADQSDNHTRCFTRSPAH